MVDAEISGESRQRFQVAYLGEDADDHAMDVDALGPALVAFGELIRAANAEVNKDKASVKVLVASDFEHKCFNINFEVIQTILQNIKDFLDAQTIEDVTELLKKLGVVGGTIATTVFGYLKWKKGRKIESVQQVAGSPGTVIVKVEGNNNTINMNNEVLRIAENKQVLEAVEGVLAPIEAKEAETIEFRQDDRPVAVFKKDDVRDIILSCEAGPAALPPVGEEEKKPTIVTATLHVYGPVFDPKAPNWRFLYKRKPIYADIRETNIAKDAVKRGGSFVHDRYRVRMEVTPPATEDGTPHYRILEVLDFTPAEQQIALPLKRRRAKKSQRSR